MCEHALTFARALDVLRPMLPVETERNELISARAEPFGAFYRDDTSSEEDWELTRAIAVILNAAEAQAAEIERLQSVVDAAWQPISELPDNPDLFVLATVAGDGRMMICRASMLARNLRGPTPNHLSFPATHWRHLPEPPAND